MLSMGPGGEGRVGCPEVAMRMSASHGDSREQTRRHVSARGRAGIVVATGKSGGAGGGYPQGHTQVIAAEGGGSWVYAAGSSPLHAAQRTVWGE